MCAEALYLICIVYFIVQYFKIIICYDEIDMFAYTTDSCFWEY